MSSPFLRKCTFLPSSDGNERPRNCLNRKGKCCKDRRKLELNGMETHSYSFDGPRGLSLFQVGFFGCLRTKVERGSVVGFLGRQTEEDGLTTVLERGTLALYGNKHNEQQEVFSLSLPTRIKSKTEDSKSYGETRRVGKGTIEKERDEGTIL